MCANLECSKGSVHLAQVGDPVTFNHLCILRNLKYNILELCVYHHASSVYLCGYSVLVH